MTAVVGRDAELSELRAFLSRASEGAAVLVLDGEAGMGKTTLWQAGLGVAAELGLRVLRALPAESETALSFSVLGDLLDGVLDEALAPLSSGQASALSRALVLEDDSQAAPDPHAVGVALLHALRGLATAGPVVIAIDDAQWLDEASAGTLAYASRRLEVEPVRMLFAKRRAADSALIDELRRSFSDQFLELDIGPLAASSLHHVVVEHLDVVLPRPLLAEVHRAAGGNPFYALEIVRTLQRSELSIEAGQPIPVPESLHDLVRGRLRELSGPSRDFLFAAAAHAHPTVPITETASGVSRGEGLSPALEARVVVLEGQRIRFTHPLLAAGAYDLADPIRRQEIHARLAELLDDPEARAWQLAAATEEADAAVAEALGGAAWHARARGAPRPGALLLERATELTPRDRPDDCSRRAVDAAYLHFESGDSRRAERQLRHAIAGMTPGPSRARALTKLARVCSYESQSEATELYLAAIEDADGDRALLAVAHDGVASSLFRLRERLDEVVEHAELAATLALDVGDDALAAEALGSLLLPETLLGRERARETAVRALALQSAAEGRRILAQPLFSVAAHYWWTDQLEASRDIFVNLLRASLEAGDESSLPYVLYLLGQVECTLGELDSAAERARYGQEVSEQAGQRLVLAYHLSLRSLIASQRGEVEVARSTASDALALGTMTGGRPAELVAAAALAHVDLVLGSASAAVDRLEPVVRFMRSEQHIEPAATRLVVDQIEALAEVARLDDACAALDWYEENARRLERASALANCARCRGLIAAQDGDPEDALASFEEALEWHAKVEIPLDRGRTLLALGVTQRRMKRRREARATLEEALAVFERIGAALWAERARAELKRISGRAATPGALTPAEERVAALVAEGKTNKEVAAALFLSDRTVEGHLAHVFGKLGIRHRAELAGALQTQGIAGSNTGDAPVSAENAAP